MTVHASTAENRASCGESGGAVEEVREYLVLKGDGKTVRYPVRDGDVEQARLRAALSQRPDDQVVIVTDDAYYRVSAAGNPFTRLRLTEGSASA